MQFCYHSVEQVPAELLVPWTSLSLWFDPVVWRIWGNSSLDPDRISWQATLHRLGRESWPHSLLGMWLFDSSFV